MEDIFAERTPEQPAFASAGEIESAMRDFNAEHPRSVATRLIALGYGPRGDKDPNFSPDFRRRFYLTEEALTEEFKQLSRHYDELYTDEWGPRLDDFLLDVRWFLKNRGDVHEGSVPRGVRMVKKEV